MSPRILSFPREAARCERGNSQVWLDPTATEEALIAEDVKADICEEEGGVVMEEGARQRC